MTLPLGVDVSLRYLGLGGPAAKSRFGDFVSQDPSVHRQLGCFTEVCDNLVYVCQWRLKMSHFGR